jgi:hypothetical protein
MGNAGKIESRRPPEKKPNQVRLKGTGVLSSFQNREELQPLEEVGDIGKKRQRLRYGAKKRLQEKGNIT